MRQHLRIFVMGVMLFVLFCGAEIDVYGYSGGEGTEENPYKISTIEDFEGIGAKGYYLLTNDIDFQGREFGGSILRFTFQGQLDGGGYTLKNITLKSKGTSVVGIFSAMSNGVIQNLNINNFNVSHEGNRSYSTFSGIIAGSVNGNTIIKNCNISGNTGNARNAGLIVGYVSGSITITGTNVNGTVDNRGLAIESYSGGFIGYILGSNNSVKIEDCSSEADIYIDGRTAYAGGIIGNNNNNNTTIKNVSYSGKIVSEYFSKSSVSAGGIIGEGRAAELSNIEVKIAAQGTFLNIGGVSGRIMNYNNALIKNINVDCEFDISNTYFAGGAFGRAGEVKDVSVEGNIKSMNPDSISQSNIGGVVGVQEGNADNCRFEGSIEVEGAAYVGGVIGRGKFLTENSSFIGSIKTTAGRYVSIVSVGGINSGPGSVNRCYVAGDIETENAITGGLIGDAEGAKISNSYFSGTIKLNLNRNLTSYGRAYTGGIAGSQNLSGGHIIENCFVMADIDAPLERCGAIIGEAVSESTIHNVYFVGTVNGLEDELVFEKVNANMTNVYFDKDIAGVDKPALYAKSTSELKSRTTYDTWGNFNENWEMIEGVSYPYLKGLPVPQYAEPVEARVISTGTESVIIGWEAVEGALGYKILFLGEEYLTKDTKYEITGLSPGTEYSISISVLREDGKEGWGTLYFNTDLENVKNIQVMEVGVTSARIAWDENENAEGYKIRINDSDIRTTHTNSIILEGLSPETQYQLPITAFNAAAESKEDAVVEFTTKSLPTPINITYTAFNLNSVNILWEGSEGALEYDVMFNEKEMRTGENKAVFNDLVYNAVYKVKVRAVNGDKYSPWSEEITVSLEAPVLSRPLNLTAVPSFDKITLRWDIIEYADSYVVKYNNESVTVTENYAVITGLSEDTEYEFKVAAVHKGHIGEESAVTVKTYSKGGMYDEITFKIEKDKIYSLSLSAESFVTFSDLDLTVVYKPEEIELVDFAGQIKEKILTAGRIEGTDLEVISMEPGKIVFGFDKSIPEEKVWSGVLTILEFKGIITGETTIIFR